MFTLDGKRTSVSRMAQTILDNSGLQLDPQARDSLALVLYRRDMLDGYLYLTALAGVREPEPLFGPLNWKEHDRRLDRIKHANSELGFRRREGTFLIEVVEHAMWQLHVNGRKADAPKQFDKVRGRLLGSLESILEEPETKKAPLYPELWYQERIARDKLRSNAHVLAPGTSLEEFARHLTVSIRDKFLEWILEAALKAGADPEASVRIGIYLDTGKSWTICGLKPIPPWLPEHIDDAPNSAGRNAFNWVRESRSAVLLQPQMSRPWQERLMRCGLDMNTAIIDPSFSGMCIVPIPHNLQPWRCMGIILLTAFGPEILPAHAYLLSRLALGVSGYLMPLLPLPGFLWMPDAKLGRGNAKIKEPVEDASMSGKVPLEVVRKAARDLLPTNSKVQIISLRAGQGGAMVYRLNVWDEGGITEVPRVLKIGPASVIERELRAYYRYAHNKKVGGASRVDIAREFYLSDDFPPPLSKMYGAIIYTLVGAGDKAVPWSEWAKGASVEDLETGLEMLADQLSDWYIRRRQAGATVVDLMLKPLAAGGLTNYLKPGLKIDPSFTRVKTKIAQLCKEVQPKKGCAFCIVHGDLHADNIFAVLSGDKKIRGVALIDWEGVQSERHPLSDISKLMTDLIYRGRVGARLRPWGFRKVRDWGHNLGCGKEDWQIALIHQIAKIMFYRYGADNSTPYINGEARLRAWDDLNKLASDLTKGRQ